MQKERAQKKNRGFSLIEMLVSISIFMMITSLTMVNYPKFSNKLSLDLLSQDVALSLRQAQISGSSVLGVKGIDGQVRKFGAYGVHFENENYDSSPGKYLYFLFADIYPTSGTDVLSGDRQYEGPSSSIDQGDPLPTCGSPTLLDSRYPDGNECLQTFSVTGANKVVSMCANFIDSEVLPENRVANCKNIQLSWLDVSFVRPNLDAKFYGKDDLAQEIDMNAVSNIGIVLQSPGGFYTKTIVVWKTGQISVE